ncbi:MAG: class F sortase [Clostridia bacterium]|nr:class F sortase [Clostridia bacterium]
MEERKTNRKKIWDIVVYAVAALLILGGAGLLIAENVVISDYSPPPTLPPTPAASSTDSAATPEQPADSPASTPEPTPTPVPTPAADPMYIYFPRFEIQSLIRSVGFASDGSIGTIDAPDIAAWFNLSAVPGEAGNSIINGHVRYGGVAGHFSVLKDMVPGDSVIVRLYDGTYRYFEVEKVEIHSILDYPAEFLQLGGDTRLTLITCAGEWSHEYGTSEDRVFVVCKPVAPAEG